MGRTFQRNSAMKFCSHSKLTFNRRRLKDCHYRSGQLWSVKFESDFLINEFYQSLSFFGIQMGVQFEHSLEQLFAFRTVLNFGNFSFLIFPIVILILFDFLDTHFVFLPNLFDFLQVLLLLSLIIFQLSFNLGQLFSNLLIFML